MKRALLFLLPLLLAAGPAAAVVDPFYRARMESGVRAFDQGNWEMAAHQLRIACFGHLDEPTALVAGLVRLAVVEVRRGDEDAFRRIFSRLVELEERFSAYSRASVPPTVREQFEGLAARLVPADLLRASAGFAAVAERADLARLSNLPPERRRGELDALRLAEPDRPDWLIELARLELELRRPQPALDWLDQLPATVGDLPPATCLRQQAASEAGSCARMDLTHPFCADVPPTVVEFRLQCLVEAGRWPEAAGLIAGLDPELRGRRRLARLERRVRDNFDGTAPAPAPADEAASVPLPEPPAVEPAAAEATSPAADSPAPRVDPQELDSLRRRLAGAASGDQLTALRSEAESLADRHPGSRQARLLAAEISYLLADWPAAVRHFGLAGELRPDEANLAFYQAVSLYESGDRAAAAEVLRPVASRLERTEFVTSYVERILPGDV